MKKIIVLLVFLTSLGLTKASIAAAVLQTDGDGQLTGVTGIFVESGSFRETYDVSFQDGSCIELFTGCNSNAEDLFPINTRLGAANAALLIAIGDISDSPESIRGCESLEECYVSGVSNINTAGPSGGSVGAGTLWIQAGIGNDFPISESTIGNRAQDLTTVANRTYAIWTPAQVTEVPIPAAFWLFGSALVGLGWLRRTKA